MTLVLEHLGHLLGDSFIGSGHLIDVFLIGPFHFIQESTAASLVALGGCVKGWVGPSRGCVDVWARLVREADLPPAWALKVVEYTLPMWRDTHTKVCGLRRSLLKTGKQQ